MKRLVPKLQWGDTIVYRKDVNPVANWINPSTAQIDYSNWGQKPMKREEIELLEIGDNGDDGGDSNFVPFLKDAAGKVTRTLPYVSRLANYLVSRDTASKVLDLKDDYTIADVPAQQHITRDRHDMAPEVLRARENDIAQVRSGYEGADAGLKDLSQRAADASRISEKSKLGAERAMLVEKSIADEIAGKNIQLGYDHVANVENINRQQAAKDMKLQARIDKVTADGTAGNVALSDFNQHLDTLAGMEAARQHQRADAHLDLDQNALTALYGQLAIATTQERRDQILLDIQKIEGRMRNRIEGDSTIGDAYYGVWTAGGGRDPRK